MDNLVKVSGGLPIISVTQTRQGPVDGILVGDVGTSGFNMFRQVQIALEKVKTDFVISAESDCLYPPDYFEFIPEKKDVCYRNSNLYVMPDARDYFFYKEEGATHSQVIGRDFYLKTLNKLFEGAPQWNPDEKNFPKERWKQEDVFDHIEYYRTDNPVFQIKTHKGMRYYTHSDRTPIMGLPYWGDGRAVRAYYLHGKVI
jgi:hypothetical protein